MAPNTATHRTIASADAIAAKRIPTSNPKDATPWAACTEFPNPTSVANFEVGATAAVELSKTPRDHRVRRIVGRRGADISDDRHRRLATQPPRRPAEFRR